MGRREGYRDCALRSGRQARITRVGLAKIGCVRSGHRYAANGQRQRAIGKHHRLGSAPLVSITVCAALLVPINWSAKARLVFESETVGVCKRTETVLPSRLAIAKSSLPSPLKSPTATPKGSVPVGYWIA